MEAEVGWKGKRKSKTYLGVLLEVGHVLRVLVCAQCTLEEPLGKDGVLVKLVIKLACRKPEEPRVSISSA